MPGRCPDARHHPRLRGAVAAAAMLLAASCEWTIAPTPPAPSAPAAARTADEPPVQLLVGGFSAGCEALQTRLLPMFANQWSCSHARDVAFETRFAGSEVLVDALTTTFRADVAVLSSPRDLAALVAAGATSLDDCARPHGGIVCRSLVVLAVRKGNPKNIRDWADLARPGVRIVMPDPARSGGGLWNLCAIYGAALRGHAGVPSNDPAAARSFLARVSENVVARAASAAESYRSFQEGTGDVAITYECEVMLAWMFGYQHERVIPSSTLLVENPAVLLARNADAHGVRTEAAKLLQFLFTTEAQQQFATCGLRPVDPDVAAARRVEFPQPQDLWTIDFLGGWEHIARELLGDAPACATPGK